MVVVRTTVTTVLTRRVVIVVVTRVVTRRKRTTAVMTRVMGTMTSSRTAKRVIESRSSKVFGKRVSAVVATRSDRFSVGWDGY
jgi:uncharacterized membrane protein